MTTKLKIVTGFTAMIIILACISVLGNRGLNSDLKLFHEFDRVSFLNTSSSDGVAAVNGSAYHLEKFMRLSDSRDMDLAISFQEQALACTLRSLEHIRLPERQKMLEQAAARLREYADALRQMKSSLAPWYDDYREIVGPAFAKAEKILGDTGDLALQRGNIAASGQINEVWRALVNLKTAFAKFRQSGREENAAVADRALEYAAAANGRFSDVFATDEGKRIFADYQASFDAIGRVYRKYRSDAIKSESILARLYEWDTELEGILNEMSVEANEDQEKKSDEIMASSASTRLIMLVSSIIGLLVGVLSAAYILTGLISTLRKVSEFAGAIAGGDFNRDSGIREKGEIGNMIAAMQQIPATLKSILDDYLRMEAKIESGAIAQKADAAKYRGGFAVLVNGTNSILTRLNMVIDSIPSPVITLSRDARIEYMNNAAQATGGKDFYGKTCKQVFDFDDDGTGADALRKAMATKQPASGETRAHPAGRDMDVEYMVIPMLDREGNLASLLQLITDLTVVKTQQRTILQATAQASEISGRVATASEELASQVEEVSRGAEVQRSRVESTASAMTEMNATVLEVARNASRASEQSEMTRSKADAGAHLVNQLVQAIIDVNKVASTLQGNMQSLGTQAESIGGVMTVISDIADQTNLLALNAAIEAARAGEAGRGFAVVADEVRKLAEKTMSATQEVSSSINAIQHSTHVNVDEVNNAVKSITTATSLADSSGEALKEIVSLASTNSSVVASIATAAEEQSATSEEINRAIEEINQVVGDTTNGMVQSSSAVQELSRMAQELRRIMDTLK